MTAKSDNEKRKFYTVNEVVALIDNTVTKAQIYRMIEKNEIPAKRLGNKILVDAKWIHNFIDSPCKKSKSVSRSV